MPDTVMLIKDLSQKLTCKQLAEALYFAFLFLGIGYLIGKKIWRYRV